MAARKNILLQWLEIALGLLVFAFGVHLTIWANIGSCSVGLSRNGYFISYTAQLRSLYDYYGSDYPLCGPAAEGKNRIWNYY